jgi:NCAIR mutase (PurE)-related protein
MRKVMSVDVERVLSRVRSGELGVARAGRELRMGWVTEVGGMARLDEGRRARAGVPEIVLAEGKTPSQVVKIARAAKGSVLVSRMGDAHFSALGRAFASAEFNRAARAALVRKGSREAVKGARPLVGVISAGTSDMPAAEEAAFVAEASGCEAARAFDVGVAGLHRLFPPLREMLGRDAKALVVAAGREGTLPSIVAGLVGIPVIGLPTSTGYGFGGKGEAALKSMLQSCSFITVVNIDNGVGAGACAALIAKGAK